MGCALPTFRIGVDGGLGQPWEIVKHPVQGALGDGVARCDGQIRIAGDVGLRAATRAPPSEA